jgi:hypothetical protein
MLAKHAQWLSYISSFYYILPSILNLHSSVDALMLSTHLVFVCLSWFGYCCHFLEELGFELRALYLLGKHSTWTIFPSPSTFFSKQELLNFNTNRKQDHHSLTTRAIHTCTRTHTHTHTHRPRQPSEAEWLLWRYHEEIAKGAQYGSIVYSSEMV